MRRRPRMTEIETRLQRALAADFSPATDILFRVQVFVRQQRAAFRRQLVEALGFACGSALVAALVFRAMDEVVEPRSVRPVVIAVLAMGYVATFAHRHLGISLSV